MTRLSMPSADAPLHRKQRPARLSRRLLDGRLLARGQHRKRQRGSVRRASLILLVLAAFTAIGNSAWGYWTAPGIGTAQATSGTLNAPTNLVASATIGSRTVTLTWTGSSLSTGAAAQGYYLTRINNSDSSTTAACGSSPTNLKPAPTCADSAVPDGTFHYTVTAVFNSWTATSLWSNNVTVRTASKLAFTTQPSSAISATALTTQPVVTVQDATGVTITTDTTSVTLTLTTPGGAALACAPNPKAAASGVASFSGCKIDKVGTYTLTASSGGLTSATSSAFNITVGVASRLAFSQQPSSSSGGTAFATQPRVTIQDAGGNTVTGSSVSVALVIGTNPSAGALSGTTSVAAASGVVTFSGLSIDKAGNGYTLTASSGGLTSATSSAFNITVGVATRLAITSSAVSGSASATASLGSITVQRQDAGGNAVTPATAIAVNLVSNSTGAKVFAATLNGTSVGSVTILSGQSGTTLYYGDTKAGTPIITASDPAASGALISATQIETITAATASQLVITSVAVSGPKSDFANLGPITVQRQDSFGNPATPASAATVNLSSDSPSDGIGIFATTQNGASVSSVIIPVGASSVDFYYGYSKANKSPMITVQSGSLGIATQQETT